MINDVLVERKKTHGDFKDHAYITQMLKHHCREQNGWKSLTAMHRESIDMILHKIGRIIAGDPNHLDHWVDIEGYARLISRELEDEK